jgi:uncharacterized protein YdiU (UPF0061 family)
MDVSKSYRPQTSWLELGSGFSDPVEATRFPKHVLRFRNQEWATRVGLGSLSTQEWESHFAKFEPLPGSIPQALALRYHGHQFQTYNKDLGDGRGFLFAQLLDERGRLLDLGTKGSGQTPYSRAGDGRLTLKGAVREVLATEMLESLGVNTSKTFSVFETGESLERGDEPSPTRSAVLVRLNHSHVRYGTFQRLGFFKDADKMRNLLDYCARHFFPEIVSLPNEARPSAFLMCVTEKAAELAAQWMMAGFVHGVLNTDNMNVTGESFDYGPYRFLPHYDPQFTAAYFDHSKLYAFGRQPETVLWNLQQLATVLTLVSETRPLEEALNTFAAKFHAAAARQLALRLGLRWKHDCDERFLILAFQTLAETEVPFEQFMFDWYGGEASTERISKCAHAAAYKNVSAKAFLSFLKERKDLEPLAEVENRLASEYYKGDRPCSLLIDEIEAIWTAIDRDDNWLPFENKVLSIREMGALHGRR